MNVVILPSVLLRCCISSYRISTGVKCDQIVLSYRSMHQDARAAVDYLHDKVRSNYHILLCLVIGFDFHWLVDWIVSSVGWMDEEGKWSWAASWISVVG